MMYDEYVKEREGLDTLTWDNGFIHYKIDGETCLLSDMYIKPEFRGKELSHEMANYLSNLARDKGCRVIMTICDLKGRNPESSLLTILKYGFKVFNIKETTIYFSKEL